MNITIDLGSVQPIGGVSLSTAAGVSVVEWRDALDRGVGDGARKEILDRLAALLK